MRGSKDGHGRQFSPEVKNIIRLSLSFARAVSETEGRDKNIVVSPYNALAALSMTAKGAKGATREEMAQTLYGVSGENLDAEVARYKALNDSILEANKDQVTIKTANGVWTNKDMVKLSRKFADGLKKDFGAEVSGEKFGPATVAKINKWASDNTNGLIRKVLDQLNPADAAVLASALYFKGSWTTKFDKALTEDKPYTTDDGVTHLTKMMQRNLSEKVAYLKGDDYEAVALTFGKKDNGKGLAPTMRLVLLRPDDNAPAAREWLSLQAGDSVPAWMDPHAYGSAKGRLEMPRMDVAESYELNGPLKDMGIARAFGAADFSGMTQGKNDFQIGRVKHDIVFKADEEGAEAAAVTTVIMRRTSVSRDTYIDFKLDRSYVLVLQDVATGAPLFIGAVNKPNGKMTPVPRP